MLLSRNFCQNSVRVNLRNFHTACWAITSIHSICSEEKIPQIQRFDVNFTCSRKNPLLCIIIICEIFSQIYSIFLTLIYSALALLTKALFLICPLVKSRPRTRVKQVVRSTNEFRSIFLQKEMSTEMVVG